jgi:ribosomal protein L35
MPKLKTRAASKRYKITGSDKFYVVTLIRSPFNEKSNRKNENYLKKSVLMIEIRNLSN